MKKASLLVLLIFSLYSCEQGKKEVPPQIIISNFNKKFLTTENVKWEKENDNEWEAEFEMNDTEYSASFSNSGVWKETEREIEVSEIPDSINTILKKNFENFDIDKVEILETPEGKFFEIGIEMKNKEFEVKIDKEGNLKIIQKD